MAPSLRDLIDFLLAEIALCGDQGASPADILSFVDAFYARSAKDASNRSHVVDRRFQEKVWQWLTRNPEVSVGKDREWNHLSLEDVEQRQPETKDCGEEAQTFLPDEKRGSPIRVFVSKERTWLAVAGHEPDETKVLPTEFALLSIIASRKSSGISQPELIKLSGQDKRSVPKRTDSLYQKGYIEKRAIQIKAARTSLCTLRRFLNSENLHAETPAGQRSGSETDTSRMIDFKSFTERLFEIMREHKIISRNDLKKLLGFADLWRWKVLSRALRKFERIGVLKRVRALSQYADTMKKYHPCVMLVRDPSEKDIEMFYEFSQQIYSNIEQGSNAVFDDDVDADGPTREASSTENVWPVDRDGDVEVSGRILPLWTPDRNVHNLIFDVIDRAGTAGLTNYDIIKACFGAFYRRPLENTLARLVECWQLSQPLHLRHLAIVRDTALQRTITHYVHYSARNFSKLVDAGEASWEAVEFIPRNAKSDNLQVPPVDAKPQIDEYGLPLDAPRKDLLQNGNASLLNCMLVVKPLNYRCSSSDARAVKLADGTYTIQSGHRKLPPGTGKRNKPSTARQCSPITPIAVKTEPERGSDVELDEVATPTPNPPKKAKSKSERFRGMSEKEKLEAMGMDETWTEYSVLLINRSDPGVYVTPRGRRRPAGKRQGRPRNSRIAVFKSPRLLSLPWFEKEHDEYGESPAASQSPQTHHDDGAPSTPAPRGSIEPSSVHRSSAMKGTKRSLQSAGSGYGPESARRTPSKLRRISSVGDEEGSQERPRAERSVVDGDIQDQGHMHEPFHPSVRAGKRRRAPSRESGGQKIANAGEQGERRLYSHGMVENGGTPSKRPRLEPANSQGTESVASIPGPTTDETHDPRSGSFKLPEEIASVPSAASRSPAEDAPVADNPPVEDSDLSLVQRGNQHQNSVVAPNVYPATPSAAGDGTIVSGMSPTPEGSGLKLRRSRQTDKGGSVAVLRKKIVMDIVEQAGGAFPMGSEIWFAFLTAWMKTKYKERPDLRTIRTAVKTLVDAGRLRQQTFCGKDSKGVMVTKTIVCKADIMPDDPIIKELQEKMLRSDSRYYFPPNVEIDPGLTKQRQRPKETRQSTDIPVENRLTVQLHQKPAAVLAMEKRRGQSIQRRLLRRLQLERDYMQITRPSGVVRLLSIQRPDADHLSSIVGYDQAGYDISSRVPRTGRIIMGDASGEQGSGDGSRRLRRLQIPISLMAPYAMLMNAKQSFNPASGTFSTNAGLAALIMARFAPPSPRSTMGKRTPRTARLPQSLDDLFSQTRRRRSVYVPGDTDLESRKFFRDNDTILKWELQNEELLQQRSEKLHYINQTVQDSFESAPVEGDIRFDDGQTDFTRRRSSVRTMTTRQEERRPSGHIFVYEEHPPFPPPPPVFESASSPASAATGRPYSGRWPRPSSLSQHRRVEKLNESVTIRGDAAASSQSRQPIRRNRLVLQLPRSLHQKLMTAIVAVRALAGGLDGRMVDWVLVSKCFPDQDPKFIQDKGKGILSRNRLQIAKMQSDFQERFIDAYADGQVPPINYDDLEGYDWDAVVEWANAQLDVPKSEKIPDLPATREQFDDIFELREDPLVPLDEIYQHQSITGNRKRALLSSVPFASPLPNEPTTPHSLARRSELSRLETVKSWIRANTVTPAEVYRPTDARTALAYIDGGLLGTALQSLVTERVVSQSNRGRIAPGRNYDITDHFLFALSKRRPIEATELRRAARFKTNTLDLTLATEGSYSLPYNAEDGDILALINLFTTGKITLTPRDPPRDKYGLTDGGYLTRQMDKDKLRFPVDIHPVPNAYVPGNPVAEKVSAVPPPCPPTVSVSAGLSLPEKFPLWFDIHGGLIQVLWDLAVAAVLGAVATRPGVSATGIASMVKPTMGAWEIELLLRWLVEVGVVVRSDSGSDEKGEAGWVVKEWWWMVLG